MMTLDRTELSQGKVSTVVDINRDMLVAKRDEVAELDDQLDSAAGGQSAGKRSVTNRLIDSTKEYWGQVVNEVSAYLNSIENSDQFAGVFAGIRQNLMGDKELNTRFDSVLSSKAEEIRAATPNFTEEELKSLSEDRRAKAKEFNSIAELLSLFGIPVSDPESPEYVEPPKRRTGAHGKRGPRAISLYTWSVDGVRMPPTTDTLTGVADANGYESVKVLRDAMKAAKIDLKNPPDEITFTMENGKVLTGTKVQPPSADVDDDDEEDEDSGETTEE